MDRKVCNTCNASLSIDRFYRRTMNKDGRDDICKVCKRVRDRKSNLKVKEFVERNMFGLNDKDY